MNNDISLNKEFTIGWEGYSYYNYTAYEKVCDLS